MYLKTLGGRKFILSMLVVILTATLMYMGKIDDGVYSTVMIAIVGAYIAGNVTQKAQTEPKIAATP